MNVLLAPPSDGTGDPEAVHRFLAPYRSEPGLPDRAPRPRPSAPAPELVEAALGAGAAVVTVGLGDPAPVAGLARRAGAPLVAMVATVADARRAVASGADAVVAQGAEAGGHRSNFVVGPHGEVPLVGTLALVPQVIRAVGVPVVAAGGIMDGRGLVAALALGAEGVQLGTLFLTAREAGSAALYRRRVRNAAETDTIVTAAVTGRPARMLRSRLVDALAREGPPPIGWPAQAAATADLRAAADERGAGDLAVHLAGQAAGMAPPGDPGAEEIVAGLVREAADAAARISSLSRG